MTQAQQNVRDKLYAVILSCQRKHNVPALHSFTVRISNGMAYVEGREGGIYIKTFTNKETQWFGTVNAAASRLALLGADYKTIDM